MKSCTIEACLHRKKDIVFESLFGGGGVNTVGVEALVENKSLENGFALWDTIASCEITGSSDSSIKNVVPNDLTPILEGADIRAIYCNGTASWKLYQKYLYPITGIAAGKLPSTRPANAAWTLPKLLDAWRMIL